MEQTQKTQIKILDREAFDYIRTEKSENKRTYEHIAKDLNGLGYSHHTGRAISGLDVSIFCTTNGFRIKKEYTKPKKHTKKIQTVLLKNNYSGSSTLKEFEKFTQQSQPSATFSPAAELAAKIIDDSSIAKHVKLTMLSKLV